MLSNITLCGRLVMDRLSCRRSFVGTIGFERTASDRKLTIGSVMAGEKMNDLPNSMFVAELRCHQIRRLLHDPCQPSIVESVGKLRVHGGATLDETLADLLNRLNTRR